MRGGSPQASDAAIQGNDDDVNYHATAHEDKNHDEDVDCFVRSRRPVGSELNNTGLFISFIFDYKNPGRGGADSVFTKHAL